MGVDNPVVIILGAFGIALNLMFSGGTLYKLLGFAKEWGVVQEKLRNHGEEIERLREFNHDLREGKIPLMQTLHKGGGH